MTRSTDHPAPDTARSITDPIDIGVDLDDQRTPRYVTVTGHVLVGAGYRRAGATNIMRTLAAATIAAADSILWVALDNGGITGTPTTAAADWVASSMDDALRMVDVLLRVIKARIETDRPAPSPITPGIVFMVDASDLGNGYTRNIRDFHIGLARTMRLGPRVGVYVIYQNPAELQDQYVNPGDFGTHILPRPRAYQLGKYGHGFIPNKQETVQGADHRPGVGVLYPGAPGETTTFARVEFHEVPPASLAEIADRAPAVTLDHETVRRIGVGVYTNRHMPAVTEDFALRVIDELGPGRGTSIDDLVRSSAAHGWAVDRNHIEALVGGLVLAGKVEQHRDYPGRYVDIAQVTPKTLATLALPAGVGVLARWLSAWGDGISTDHLDVVTDADGRPYVTLYDRPVRTGTRWDVDSSRLAGPVGK